MLILYNAHILTLNPQTPSAQAMAIESGRIAFIGSNEQILELYRPGDRREDMGGQTVWPGLTDAHLHLENYALSLSLIDCETPTKAECLRRVAAKAAQARPGEWIRGHGWNQNDWGGYGTIDDLDHVAPNNPVYLTQKSLHAGWANSAAMRLAGIDENTPDPDGGMIEHNPGGHLTGILFETAYTLVENVIPNPSLEETTEMLENAQQKLWRFGITAVHDFDRRSCFMGLQWLNEQKRLRLRVIKSIPFEELDQAVSLGLRTGFGDDFLRIGSVKLFADGALSPHSAAMFHPYEGTAECGMLMMNGEELYDYGRKAATSGISLAVHAIGDRANHEVINAYEELRRYEAENHLPALRHRIEHVQLIHPDDKSRMARSGIIASMQPIHATSDMYTADRDWGERTGWSYAWRTLVDEGTAYAFGSDAPVESPNPYLGLHAAVTRMRVNGEPGPEGWRPEQRLTLHEALLGFTRGAAYAAGMEDRLGALTPGYFADLQILSSSPFALPPSEIHKIQPLAVMVNGEWVWRT